MSKYRIVKLSEYRVLHQLERKTIFGYIKIMTGTEDQCRNSLERIKNSGIPNRVIFEEEI